MRDTWNTMDPDGVMANAISPAVPPKVLILTPVKDAADMIDGYCDRTRTLSYPHSLISIGFLESDSRDDTYERTLEQTRELGRTFRRARLWKKDFGYRIPEGMPRWDFTIQGK